MPDPSPTTASIVQAFDDRYELLGPFDDNWQEVCLAAALRKLEDILAQDRADPMPLDLERAVLAERIRLFRRITTIAAELEAL
jgi:hypothetical protein